MNYLVLAVVLAVAVAAYFLGKRGGNTEAFSLKQLASNSVVVGAENLFARLGTLAETEAQKFLYYTHEVPNVFKAAQDHLNAAIADAEARGTALAQEVKEKAELVAQLAEAKAAQLAAEAKLEASTLKDEALTAVDTAVRATEDKVNATVARIETTVAPLVLAAEQKVEALPGAATVVAVANKVADVAEALAPSPVTQTLDTIVDALTPASTTPATAAA